MQCQDCFSKFLWKRSWLISWFMNYVYCWILRTYLLHKKLNKILQGTDRLFVSIWNFKSLCFTCFDLSLFVVRLPVTCCHSFSLAVTHCYSSPLVIICCHSFYKRWTISKVKCGNKCFNIECKNGLPSWY